MSTTDLPFDLPDGHVVVENVSRDVQLPFEGGRIIRTGDLWHLPEEEAAGHEAAAGHQQWKVRRDLMPGTAPDAAQEEPSQA